MHYVQASDVMLSRVYEKKIINFVVVVAIFIIKHCTKGFIYCNKMLLITKTNVETGGSNLETVVLWIKCWHFYAVETYNLQNHEERRFCLDFYTINKQLSLSLVSCHVMILVQRVLSIYLFNNLQLYLYKRATIELFE